MTDPVIAKNAKRQLASHRIDDARFTPPAAEISCLCGWRRQWEEYEEGDIEAEWNLHKRQMGERSK